MKAFFGRKNDVIRSIGFSIVIFLTGMSSVFAGKFPVEPVKQCIIRNLRVNLEKDISLRKGTLPDAIDLSVGKKDATELFNVSVNLWSEDWSAAISRLKSIAAKAEEKGRLTGGESDELSDLRTELKMMRYVFEALSDDHDVPSSIDELATAVGKLRDRSVDQIEDDVRSTGTRVLKALRDKHIDKIDDAVAHFHPTHRKPFAKWLSETIDETEKIVARGKGTPVQFHQVRKNLQSFLTIVQLQLSLVPNDLALKQAYRILVRETELLGGKVDQNDTLAIEGELDLKHDEIRFDPKLMAEIQDMLDRIKKGSL